MADIRIGDTIEVTRTEVEEPNIIDVDIWLAYRVINGTIEALPIDTLSVEDGITITEPVSGEGERAYSISWTHVVEDDVVVGNTYQILFVPGGTEADQAGILDWLDVEYDITALSITKNKRNFSFSYGYKF
jgi:hypothetical protein